MEYVIGLVIIFLGLITYSLIMRKRIYDEVSRLEAWKMEVMNRPVTEEISRVKALNLTGQAEEKFESWRKTWDEIVTQELPKAEEMLFDAEEAVDKYRYNKAKKINAETSDLLKWIDEQIDTLLAELQELLGSEEQNRVDNEELRYTFKQLKKRLLTERHTFGKAEEHIEAQLGEIEKRFTDVETETEQGNYFQAREIVLEIKERLTDVHEKTKLIPNLLTDCQTHIPSQIQELRSGFIEMVEQDYVLSHLAVEEELEKMEEQLVEYEKLVEKAEIAKVKDDIADMKENIEQIYDALEKEAISKQIVLQDEPTLEPVLERLKEQVAATKEESMFVQMSYHLTEKDLETQHRLEKDLNYMMKKYYEVRHRIEENDLPATKLRHDLEEIAKKVNEMKETHKDIQEMLQTLRKDEIEAREKLREMNKKLLEVNRLVRKSTLPGVPKYFWSQTASANDSLQAVEEKLEEKPLDMASIRRYLDEAVGKVNNVYEEITHMLDQAALAEKVIQYGNRYRSQYPFVAARLIEAEEAFRACQYEQSLEIAASSLQELDPDVLSKVSQLLEKNEKELLLKGEE
ncbi:septation ring formation regulator EzrA [Bacillus tianshenii]|nr:septation ring formation regulator EzrA [Bacillus tianshenii]